MLGLDLGLEGLLLVVSSIALVFIVKARRTLIISTLNRGIFFLSFVIFLEIVENVVGLYVGFRREADTITLETVTIAITVTALYYAASAKKERASTNEFLLGQLGAYSAKSQQPPSMTLAPPS